MQFVVSSSSLLKQLQLCGSALQSNNTLPILDNFLFELSKGKLVICATDLETTIISSLKVESKDSGNIAVPAKILMETVRTFPEMPLTFSLDKKTHSVEITSDYGKYKLSGHDAADYPKPPSLDSPATIELPASLL